MTYTLLFTIYIIVISLISSCYCNPIKHSTSQLITDCYGIECPVDMEFLPTLNPQHLAQTVMTALPNLENTQNKTVALLEKYDKYLENVTTTVSHVLERHYQQMHNLTATMTILFDNVAHLLQSQLSILSERLPPPPQPLHCQDIIAQGLYGSGIYTITPHKDFPSFKVYCDVDSQGISWTVFQRRFDGSVDFFRDWADYEHGFGSAEGEYWAGLKNIHRLTQTGSWILRINLEDFSGQTAYAQYDSFQLGDAELFYRLSVGAYSGNAGDSLTYHNNQGFTTKQSHNDQSAVNCAQYQQGGWWYNDCARCNLNGLYLGNPEVSVTGMTWFDWKNAWVTLKKSEMKVHLIQ